MEHYQKRTFTVHARKICHLKTLEEAIKVAVWKTWQQFIRFLNSLINKRKDKLCGSTLWEPTTNINTPLEASVLSLGNYYLYHNFYLDCISVPPKLTLHLHPPYTSSLTPQSLRKENTVAGWVFLLILLYLKGKYGKVKEIFIPFPSGFCKANCKRKQYSLN